MYRTTSSLPAIYVNARTIHLQNNSDSDRWRASHHCEMPLSTSRQQFLASESRESELQYKRKGGFFVSRCTCCVLVLLAIVAAALTGVATYFLATEKSLFKTKKYIWSAEDDKLELTPSPDLRLPNSIVPSSYRLKLVPKLNFSTFSGEVYITLSTKERGLNKIILHSKNLDIDKNKVTVTEQVYQKINSNSGRFRREIDVNNTSTNKQSNSTVQLVTQPVTATIPNKTNETNTINETKKFGNKESSQTLKKIEMSSKNQEVTESDNVTATVNNRKGYPMSFEKPNIPSVDIQVTRSDTRNVAVSSVILDSKNERLIITLQSALKPNIDYTLELFFNGSLTNSLTGFYKSSYIDSDQKTKEIAITQFEPTSARAAFPCFDEPGFKAMFEISIAHPDELTALSNMADISKEPIISSPGWTWTHFDRSVQMSTYLVAYGIIDFTFLESSYVSMDKTTRTIRIWARKQQIHKAKYALSIAPKIIAFYEELFGIPYTLSKLDLVAIPDFSNGAMENWGLITFRETFLLYDDKSNSTEDKQTVARSVAHELAHQWFGNLVTMAWWNDLWLNEGFATYVQFVGVDKIEPQWRILDDLVVSKMSLLRRDALHHTTPLSAVINDASEITQKFDEISYYKGSSLIRWLNYTVTEKVFRKGLVHYLNKWKYSNAQERDLWSSMSEAVSASDVGLLNNISIVQFMSTWTEQPGFPLLTVKTDYNTQSVTFTQSLFSTVATSKSRQNQIWWIPISYVKLGENVSEWDTKPKVFLKEKEMTVNIPITNKQMLYVNVDNIGYYRVNYDTQTWSKLSELLLKRPTALPACARAQLTDDAFNLAKASLLSYDVVLDLSTFLINETSDMVWTAALDNINFIKYSLTNTHYLSDFHEYVLSLMDPVLRLHEYGARRPASDKEALFVETLLYDECAFGSARCVNWAKGLFSQWLDRKNITDNPIPKSRRSLVYSVAVKYGTKAEFDFLWSVYLNANDHGDKEDALKALTSTRDVSLVTLLLERSLSEVPAQSTGLVWAMDSDMSARAVQRYLLANWARIYKLYSPMENFVLASVLDGAFGWINTQDDLDTFNRFVENNYEALKSHKQSLLQIADSAMLRINWVQQNGASVARWLNKYNKRAAELREKNTISSNVNKTAEKSDTTKNVPQNISVTNAQDISNKHGIKQSSNSPGDNYTKTTEKENIDSNKNTSRAR